jgi:HK97 family phage major capsid protein
MSTQPAAGAGAGQPGFFKDQAELEAFLKRVVVEEAGPAVAKAMAPYTEKHASIMRDMLEEASRDKEATKVGPGLMFARMVRALALAHIETGRKGPELLEASKGAVEKHWGKDDPVLKGIEGSLKLAKATASQVGDATSLGNFIIPQWSREFIQLLRNQPVVRSLARVIPNPTGSLTLRRQTSGGIAYWVGEGGVVTASKPGVGLMSFLRKKLAALSVMSNDMIRFGGPEADQFVLDDLLLVSAIAEDLAFIRSLGTEFSPKGIRYLTAAANVFAQSGTTLAAIDTDFAQAKRLVEEANVFIQPDTAAWLMIPRTYYALWNAKPATDAGARPYREELKMREGVAPQGRVLGDPVRKTNQIPKNLGGGSNESETYYVHGPSLLIADTLNTQVDVFPGGAYEDGGVAVSGISRDETVLRVLRETDFNMRYAEAAAVITGVTIS